MENAFDHLRSLGWDWIQYTYRDGTYQITVGKEAWFTDNLYAARELPSGKGSSFEAALKDLSTHSAFERSGDD